MSARRFAGRSARRAASAAVACLATRVVCRQLGGPAQAAVSYTAGTFAVLGDRHGCPDRCCSSGGLDHHISKAEGRGVKGVGEPARRS